MKISRDLLIICGASVRAAASAARRDKKTMIGIDLFGDVDTREACAHWFLLDRDNPANAIGKALDACEQMTSTLGNDSVQSSYRVPVAFTGGYESWGWRLTGKLRGGVFMLAPSWDIVELVRSVKFLAGVAATCGVRFPRTFEYDSSEVWEARAQNRRARPFSPTDTGRWLIKRTDSAGGIGARFFEPAISEVQPDDDRNSRDVLQEYIPGIPIGANFVSNGRDVGFLGACRSTVVSIEDRPFVYGGSWGILELGEARESLMLRVARQVVSATGLRGLFGIDFLIRRSDQTLWLLEINPRYTASMELFELLGDCSLSAAHQETYTDENFDVTGFSRNLREDILSRQQTTAKKVAKKVVWAAQDVVWQADAIESTKDGQHCFRYRPAENNHPSDLNMELADIPADGTKITKGQPIVTLICSGTNWSCMSRYLIETERKLLERISATRAPGETRNP